MEVLDHHGLIFADYFVDYAPLVFGS